MPNYSSFDDMDMDRSLIEAARYAQSSYRRPDPDVKIRWWRLRRTVEAFDSPHDETRSEKAARQRNLMNTGDADPTD